MKKIFLYHLGAFVGGAVLLAGYFFWKASVLEGAAGLAVVVLAPIAVVYIIALGIFCAISCLIWITLSYFRTRGES